MECLGIEQDQDAYRLAATLCYTEQEGLELLEAMDVSLKPPAPQRMVVPCGKVLFDDSKASLL